MRPLAGDGRPPTSAASPAPPPPRLSRLRRRSRRPSCAPRRADAELQAAPRLRRRAARARHLRDVRAMRLVRHELDRDPARRADGALDARRRLRRAPPRRELATAIALTGGVVVAVALFHVLPEAIEAVGDAQQVGAPRRPRLPRLLPRRARARPPPPRRAGAGPRARASVGALGAAGLSLHSFIDGLGIGLAFGLDTATGLLVFLAVISHDFADGLNTVSFVLRQSNDRRQAVRWLAIDAAAPLSARSSARSLTVSEESLGSCSPSTPASSCSWARPTCSRTRTSTRRRRASRSPSPASGPSSRSASSPAADAGQPRVSRAKRAEALARARRRGRAAPRRA